MDDRPSARGLIPGATGVKAGTAVIVVEATIKVEVDRLSNSNKEAGVSDRNGNPPAPTPSLWARVGRFQSDCVPHWPTCRSPRYLREKGCLLEMHSV